ncbi:MAG: N4-gp56 family major capsid protein [Oscillospiraceae bacterium]|nr:N4-gp56 family major capsid protein [Oscillospiraceae bacterium]
MAVNYASKYSEKIDERFTLGSLTGGAVNQDYDWIGVETVNVYSVPTVAMNDYSTTGTNRYGDPTELGNNVQELKVSQDRSFTFTIDKKSRDDTQMTMEAGKALQRQIDEVIIPEVDTYRLNVICAGAGSTVEGDVDSTNAYEAFLNAQEKLDEAAAPQGGRICYCTSAYYKCIKLDEAFTKMGDLATNISIHGQVGEIDGVPVVKVPSSYLPSNANFVITNPACTPAPSKLTEYTIHENPPGISGWLVEGRVRYDAFVLDNKASAICVHVAATA